MSREVVRLWVRRKDDEHARRAIEMLREKCEIVILESPGAKEPELATSRGVFYGLEQIEYFAKGWI
jgi:hypothetical protein